MPIEANVRVFRGLPEIEEVRPAWESWPGHRDSDIEMFSVVVRSNPETLQPHVIAAYRDGRPAAILIGRIDLTTLALRVGYWRVPAPRVRLLTFVIGAQRGNSSPEVTELLLREALESLRRGEADAIRMEFLRADSLHYQLARSLPSVLGRDRGAAPGPHWMMDLPKTYEDVLGALSGDLRWQLKRKAKKIQSSFPTLLVKCFEKPEHVDDMLRDVETVASKSYQRGLGVGFHNNDDTRCRLLSQMARGKYLGYALYLEGRPAAFWLGSFYDRVFYSDFLGFDPEFGAHSPGTFLQIKVLEDLLVREAIRIDFGPGDARYKTQFGTTCHQEVSLYCFPSTFRGATLNLLRALVALANRVAKAAASGAGVLPQIKTLLRNRKRPDLKRQAVATKRAPEAAPRRNARKKPSVTGDRGVRRDSTKIC